MNVAAGRRPTDTLTVAGSTLENTGALIGDTADTMTADQLAAYARDARAAAADLELAAVIIARQDGRPWADIGAMLGVTRQSAHERYAHQLPRTLA